MSKPPKIAKPRPVKWGKPYVSGSGHREFWVVCYGTVDNKTCRMIGPVRGSEAAAIRAWNKQESKR